MKNMTLSEELSWRGLIKDKTFADITWLNDPKAFYLGVDVGSADSMTIGNLAVFLLARRLLEAGWKTILLVGGATSLVGDPGGKDDERPLISREQVEHNKTGIAGQVKQLFAGQDFILVDNYDWFKDVNYLDFLREVGKNYSMTELLQRDFIADRIGEGGSGISYAEFSYSLVQGYDYLQIYKNHGVVMQIGGSDQWGNMLSGVPLIRKKENAEAHAMSMPLVVNKTTGKKFGKSEGGAIWLDGAKTSVYKFYQFWLNADDAGVEDYLKIYTLMDKEEIDALMTEFHRNPGARSAQKTLAYEVTAIVHGKDRAESVKRISETLFGGGNYTDLTEDDLKMLEAELATCEVKDGVSLTEILVSSGLASSNSEARRFLQDKAVYINGEQLDGTQMELGAGYNMHGYAIIRRGKNNVVLVKFS